MFSRLTGNLCCILESRKGGKVGIDERRLSVEKPRRVLLWSRGKVPVHLRGDWGLESTMVEHMSTIGHNIAFVLILYSRHKHSSNIGEKLDLISLPS